MASAPQVPPTRSNKNLPITRPVPSVAACRGSMFSGSTRGTAPSQPGRRAAASSAGNRGRPSGLTAVNTATSSARPSAISRDPTRGPPSLKTRVTPRCPRAAGLRQIDAAGRTAATRAVSTPAAASATSRSAGAAAVATTKVGNSRAVATSREASSTSRTTRNGFCATPGSRTVGSNGSCVARPIEADQ